MKQTIFHLQGMDCSSEEQMIRMRMEGVDEIEGLTFDLTQRHLTVHHHLTTDELAELLRPLNMGATLLEHSEDAEPLSNVDDSSNRRPLMWALTINFTLFLGELTTGLWFGSMGLVADSLDMMADALVYALSLAAVGGSLVRKRQLAAASGYLQVGLACFGLIEVIRRFLFPAESPNVSAMIIVSLLALAANVATLFVLQNTTRGEAHIEASWIFTSNDIKINILVIIAGVLVWWSSSQIPDLLVGGLIFMIVANGARRILALARQPADQP